ncbi:hypothetical protein N9L29_04145 [Litoricolaceae bacterium]|nr:hypothetical protein [Litorivicinaceae bacterium]
MSFLSTSACIQFLLILLLSLSIVLELHGYFIKTANFSERQSLTIGFSNWVIYLARILNMGFAFLLAFAFEYGLTLQLSVIFASAFLLGTILSAWYVSSRRAESLLNLALGFILYMPFRELKGEGFWRSTKATFSYRWVFMVISAGMAYFAILMPFFVARMLPEFRMTSVFLGQALNFGSTLILLGMIEPRMMADLDRVRGSARHPEGLNGFIHGRVWLTAFMALICFTWLIFFSE